MNETELAKKIMRGETPSPVEFTNMWLVNLRITGTGLAYRAGINEHVWRDPSIYLNDEFLNRCNGLPVIENHPDDATLNEEEFKKRIVGSVMLPYIKGDEVWAVCRIYVWSIVEKIITEQTSTSPNVIFNADSGNILIEKNDTKLLIEGVPFLIDHIALVTAENGGLGVWDKGQEPASIDVSNIGKLNMTEEELKKAIADAVAPLASSVSTLSNQVAGYQSRADSMEKKLNEDIKARADAEAEAKAKADEEEKAKEEKARADAEAAEAKAKEEEEAKAKADAEAEEKAKADAEAEEKAKADAVADESAMADAQSKADSAYTACGKKAPAPYAGEKSIDYRKRVLRGLLQYAPDHEGVDVNAIADSAALGIIENAIFSSAKKSIDQEMANTVGKLIERTRTDLGRYITEFKGDMNAWLNPCKARALKLVKFNNEGSRV